MIEPTLALPGNCPHCPWPIWIQVMPLGDGFVAADHDRVREAVHIHMIQHYRFKALTDEPPTLPGMP